MHKTILVGLSACLALAIHVSLGWIWTPIAAIAAGFYARTANRHKSWIFGALSLALSWSTIVLYSLLHAATEVLEMGRVIGALLGGLPGSAVFMITVLIGGVLGALGGQLGSSLSDAFSHRSTL